MSTRNDFIHYNVTGVPDTYNMDLRFNTFYYAATSTMLYTYNLPAITCDGIKFKLIRADRFYTSTLTVNSSNNIIFGGTTSTSLNVTSATVLIFISFNSTWYVSKIGETGFIVPRSLFSGNFTANNGSVYRTFPGTGTTPVLFSVFSFLGTSGQGERINIGLFNVYFVSGNPSVTISLRNSTGVTTYMSVGPTTVLTNTVLSMTNAITPLPTTQSVLGVYILVAGNNTNRVGIASFSLY